MDFINLSHDDQALNFSLNNIVLGLKAGWNMNRA